MIAEKIGPQHIHTRMHSKYSQDRIEPHPPLGYTKSILHFSQTVGDVKGSWDPF